MFKRMMIPMVAVMVAVALAFGTSAFNNKSETYQERSGKTLLNHTFYFKPGSVEEDISNPDAYQSSATGITCSMGDLPCQISVPDLAGTTPEEDLEAYLANTSPQDVVDNAIATRP